MEKNVMLLLVLLIAPSAMAHAGHDHSSAVASPPPPGSAGFHGYTQAMLDAPPTFLRSAISHNVEGGEEDLARLGLQDPANVQQMTMHDDGQYSFSYQAANSARQERRNLDGSVQGSYSYVNPEGKLMQVDYTADARTGFHASGDGVPPAAPPAIQVPYVPQDTPEVAQAKAQFLEYYQREFNARKLMEAQKAAEVALNAGGKVELRFPNPDASDDDTVVITINSEESGNGAKFNHQIPQRRPVTQGVVSKVEPGYNGDNGNGAYQLQYTVGQAQQQQQQRPLVTPPVAFNNPLVRVTAQVEQGSQATQASQITTKSSLNYPAYFYYVGQGGLPYYVTSVPNDPQVPVSLRASQIGAAPVAAIHDVQTPNYGQKLKLKANPPLYLEVGSDYADPNQPKPQVPQPNHQVAQPVFYTSVTPGTTSTGLFSRPPLVQPAAGAQFPFFGLPLLVYN